MGIDLNALRYQFNMAAIFPQYRAAATQQEELPECTEEELNESIDKFWACIERLVDERIKIALKKQRRARAAKK